MLPPLLWQLARRSASATLASASAIPPWQAAAAARSWGCSWRAIQQRQMSTRAVDLPAGVLAKARKLSLAVGSVAGAFGSVVGVGGGVLIAPVILNTCPGIPQRLISGTSLAAVATTGATAGYVYWSSGSVDLRYAGLLAAGAVLTAPLGARATQMVNCHTLRMALGYWLYFVAPLVPLKAVIFSRSSSTSSSGSNSDSSAGGAAIAGTAAVPATAAVISSTAAAQATTTTAAAALPTTAMQPASAAGPPSPAAAAVGLFDFSAADAAIAATGCLAGFASGLLGIGGGTVITPLLAVFSGMPQQLVLGTSLSAMVIPSLIGLAQHQHLGNVDWRMAAALAMGTMAGSYIGGSFAISASDGLLEAAFAVGMLLLGRQTLQGARKLAASAAAASR